MNAKLIAIFVLAELVILIYQSYVSKKAMLARLKKRIKEQWGKPSEREYEQKEYDKISYYFNKKCETGNSYIDDITWNDLEMDSLFMTMNTTYSSAGEEYLYNMLRMPVSEKDSKVLSKRDSLISYFEENEEDSLKLEETFASLGRTKNISFSEFIDRLNELDQKSNMLHYLLDVLFGISLISVFIIPALGILFLLIMIGVNVFVYYKRKAEVESYFICLRYIVRMQSAAEGIAKSDITELDEYTHELKDMCKTLAPIGKGIFLLAPKNLDGSIGEIIMEYVRIITHVDLIKFNSMLKLTKKYKETISGMFDILGELESAIAIASYRKSLVYYTKPDFSEASDKHMDFTEIYHPLISEPVSNSLNERRCVLLTGSNASGKSTFLKTIAINAIFAQTIFTCTAKTFSSCYYKIYTSMALRDNLQGSESYYIVEIKSLKRILDSVSNGEKVLCFVDEVLRGTNTVERIAASMYILKNLEECGAMCFAATHDVELTQILENYYSNYHFQEEVKDNDVLFNYLLYKGHATSRNAIKLLGVIGYDDVIINNAEKAASDFLNTGVWKSIEQIH